MTGTWNGDDVAPLSPRALAAIASIGSDRDLRLCTTLRRDVHVWTTWLPVQEGYETFVIAPRDVSEAMTRHGVAESRRYATKDEAEGGHVAYCDRVTTVLQAMTEER